MTSTLLISQKVIAEFGPRLNDILAALPRPLAPVPFTPDLKLTPADIDTIEVAYFSRDIWEGTEKSTLSPAAQTFWHIVDQARNLKWMAVYSAGMDAPRYQDAMKRGIRITSSAGAQSESVGLAAAISVV